jgi:hypothetical protein
VGLEQGPLSLVSTIEELLGRKSSGSSLENRECGRGDPLRWPCDTLYPQKLALTLPTCCGHSVGIVRLRTETTEFFCCCFSLLMLSSYDTNITLETVALHTPNNAEVFITDAPAKRTPMICPLSKLDKFPIFRFFHKDCHSTQSLMPWHEHYKV